MSNYYTQPQPSQTTPYTGGFIGTAITPIGSTIPTMYGYGDAGYKPKTLITTEVENKLFYFKCHFDPTIFDEILGFKLTNISYYEHNSSELTYQALGDELKVLISNNTKDKTSSFIFTLEEKINKNSYNYNVKLVNNFKKEFMLLADKPSTKCDSCLFIIDAKLETFCNKTYKFLGINNA